MYVLDLLTLTWHRTLVSFSVSTVGKPRPLSQALRELDPSSLATLHRFSMISITGSSVAANILAAATGDTVEAAFVLFGGISSAPMAHDHPFVYVLVCRRQDQQQQHQQQQQKKSRSGSTFAQSEGDPSSMTWECNLPTVIGTRPGFRCAG